MNTDNNSIKFIRVYDTAGNPFICPLDALQDVKQLTEDELGDCIDDGLLGRYAGNIEIVDSASA